MKKLTGILACLLAMLMLFAPVLAEDEMGVIVQSSCNIVQSGEYYLVYCFARVHNNSDQVLCLDEGTLHLADGETLLAQEEVSQLWPYFLAPGEDGYLFDVVPFAPGENGPVMPNVTGLSYQITYLPVNAIYAGTPLETQASIELDEDSGAMSVVCAVSNPTQADAYNPVIAFGLYTEGGQMIYAGGVNQKNIGIPAGGTVLIRFDVDEALTQQWLSYGAVPAQVHVNAMFRGAED